MYIDSHAHISESLFDNDIEAVLQRAKEAGVEQIINICTDQPTLEKGVALAKKHPWIHNAAAVTPHDVETLQAAYYPLVVQAAEQGLLVAIGETGLDYHREVFDKKLQQEVLLLHFALAHQHNLPLIVHCRNAFDDLFSLADRHYKGKKLLLHCFTGTLAEAKNILERGWFISISGIVTFPKAQELKETVAFLPLDRLLIETDAPFLAPQSHRGARNEPAFLAETARAIADIKNLTLKELSDQTSLNAKLFFDV